MHNEYSIGFGGREFTLVLDCVWEGGNTHGYALVFGREPTWELYCARVECPHKIPYVHVFPFVVPTIVSCSQSAVDILSSFGEYRAVLFCSKLRGTGINCVCSRTMAECILFQGHVVCS